MKNIASGFGKAAVLFGLVGMALGLKMGITGDHDHISSHAHISLLGWVSLMLFGLYYKNYPDAGKTKLARAHLWLSAGGAAFLGLGVFTIDLGNPVIHRHSVELLVCVLQKSQVIGGEEIIG